MFSTIYMFQVRQVCECVEPTKHNFSVFFVHTQTHKDTHTQWSDWSASKWTKRAKNQTVQQRFRIQSLHLIPAELLTSGDQLLFLLSLGMKKIKTKENVPENVWMSKKLSLMKKSHLKVDWFSFQASNMVFFSRFMSSSVVKVQHGSSSLI